jgi:hypothetical protein
MENSQRLEDAEDGDGRPMRGSRLLWILLLAFLLSKEARAAGERIVNLNVSLKGGEITLSAELVKGFSRQVVQDLQNGIPKDFYFYFLLKRKQKGWFDEEIYAKTLRYTVKYDRLKNQFLVTRRDGVVVEEMVLENLEAAEGLISKINGVRMAPLSLLKPKGSYYISVKAQMKASKLPLYLDYFLFFIPFLELDTPWADSRTFNGASAQ